MRLDLAENETTPDAAPSIGDGDITDIAEPAADAAAAESAADVAADPGQGNPFEGIDLDALRALAEVAPHLLTATTPPTPTQPTENQDGPPELDPFDPDSVRAYNDYRDQQLLGRIEGMINPLAERAQAEAAAQQNELLMDAAHDIEVKKGEFLGGDEAQRVARTQMLGLAKELMPQMAQRYGMTDRAAELALEAAYDQVKQYENAVVQAAETRYKNGLATLANADTEPATGGGAVRGAGEAESVSAALERWKAQTQTAA